MKKISLVLFIFISFSGYAQTDKATTKRIVEAKNFIFVASSAMPMNSTEINNILSRMSGVNGGGNIDLSGNSYDVRITPDSLIAFLPYYGRSFNAPLGREDAGYKFTSTKFSYESTARKKGGWMITLNPQDTKDGVRMNLTISTNGYASLTVNSNNKQSIMYDGYLTEPKPKELTK